MTHDLVYATGQRVGDYRLLRQLGAGGFADVYLAEPLYDEGQPVAIKLLTHLVGTTDGLHAFTRFIQEARMIHLKHPHIVPVQDFGISREGIRSLEPVDDDPGDRKQPIDVLHASRSLR